LRTFLARRDYDSAVQYYRTRLLREVVDVADVRNLARVYDHWHKFDSSLAWWNRVLEHHPDDSAIVGRWNALYRRDEKDTVKLEATKKQIAAEASAFLAETTARSITLAWDGLSLSDTLLAPRVGWLLMEQFPFSPRAYEVTGNAFYDSLAPVWTNDTLKIPIIRRFLTRLPKTEWRQTFYMFMLSSRFGLKDTAGLRADAAEMVADDTLDPFRYRYAASLFNRLKFDPKTAEKYARKAIELEPTAKKSPNKPQEQWDLEYPPLYGQARLALAEALVAQGKSDSAKTWLIDARRQFKWDSNSEWTPAPFDCLSGEIESAKGKTEEAVNAFGRAVTWGDSRNYWTARADSDVQRLWGMSERQLFGSYAANTNLDELFFPFFSDVTDSFGLKDRHESRVAWGDYNNDGYQDLLLNGCVLFRNDSGRRFVDVTDSVGLSKANGRGGLFADFNNDGWLDLYVSGAEDGARFYKNDSGRFVNLSDRAGGPGRL
jgi:tetratricopeptide (TPR) repeat protein